MSISSILVGVVFFCVIVSLVALMIYYAKNTRLPWESEYVKDEELEEFEEHQHDDGDVATTDTCSVFDGEASEVAVTS